MFVCVHLCVWGDISGDGYLAKFDHEILISLKSSSLDEVSFKDGEIYILSIHSESSICYLPLRPNNTGSGIYDRSNVFLLYVGCECKTGGNPSKDSAFITIMCIN